MAGHAVIRELCIQSQWWEWGKEDISFLLLFSPQVWLHAVKFPCRLLTWGDLCWGKYSPAPLTPCRPREFLVFKKLQKHESVELLHKLNWSYSSLRNVLSWSLFFFFQLSSLSVFYIAFSTPGKILLLLLEFNLAKTFIIYYFSSVEQDSFIWQIFQCFV